MKFSAKIVHEAKNNLKHFRVVVINPVNSGSIFLFCESVVVSTIMEKTDERIFMIYWARHKK